MICIHNAKVVLENGILFDGIVLIDDGRIVAVGDRRTLEIPADAELVDAGGAYVGPGFVDIHNHGGNNCQFDADPAGAAEFFLQHGETTVLATLYYNLSKEQFLESTRRVRAVMETEQGKNIAGFYMEGPYMNPKYGASPEKNQWRGPITREDYTQIVDCAGPAVRVWAIAPEREGIEPFMAYAKEVNPQVSFAVGHSEATFAQIRKLKKYGLHIQTHCMDATGQSTAWLGTRGNGPDEACFLDPDMYAELICDSVGAHVSPVMQRLMLHNKGVERMILITDSYVGRTESPEGLRHVKDLTFDDNGNLCGSRMTMDMACRNIMTHTNCGIAQAFLMASLNPARAIGMDEEVGSIEVGKRANLVLVDDVFHVEKVMLEGRFQKERM